MHGWMPNLLEYKPFNKVGEIVHRRRYNQKTYKAKYLQRIEYKKSSK